jgi:hypothetical protein
MDGWMDGPGWLGLSCEVVSLARVYLSMRPLLIFWTLAAAWRSHAYGYHFIKVLTLREIASSRGWRVCVTASRGLTALYTRSDRPPAV